MFRHEISINIPPRSEFAGGVNCFAPASKRNPAGHREITLQQGDAVIFPVRQRPVQGFKRRNRVNIRHGFGRVLSGQRFTLGLIFHDAQ